MPLQHRPPILDTSLASLPTILWTRWPRHRVGHLRLPSSSECPRTALAAADQTGIRVGRLFVHRARSISASAPVHPVNVTNIVSLNHHLQRSAQPRLCSLLHLHSSQHFPFRRTIKALCLSPLDPPLPLFPPTHPTLLSMSGPALSHSQAAPRALAPHSDPAHSHPHSIHSRIPSDDLFPFPRASASLSPSSPSQHNGAQQPTHVPDNGDAPMFDTVTGVQPLATAAGSPITSPVAPQPRSHFASAATESNLNNTLGPVNPQSLNAQLTADSTYNTDRNDMTQYLSFQEMDAQNLTAARAASPPTTASPSFQGSPASWTPELDGSTVQQSNAPHPQLFPAFADLHHPQHQLPGTGGMNSATGQAPIGLDLMTTFTGLGGLGGTEGDYFLSPWTPEGGNAFQLEPPRSPYEMALGDDFDMAKFCKEQDELQRLMSGTSPLSAHVEQPSLPFTQGNASSPFFPETPPPPSAHRLPFPIQSPDDLSPSPGIAPRELELPPHSAGGLTSSPTFAPASATFASPPRWIEAFDVPRSQALDIQPGPNSPGIRQTSTNVAGFIPPPPLTTGPVPMPMPFSQNRHGHHHPYAGSRGHSSSSSLTLSQLFQPASAPPHPGADFHTHRSRVRTYSQRTGSALRDALRAEAFASGNASQSQPHSQGLPNDDSSGASLPTSFDFRRVGQHGSVGSVGTINRQRDMDMGDNMSTIRGSAYGIGGGEDADATVRKRRRTSTRLPTATPSPRGRLHSLPRDSTPASEASVDRERDLPQRSELRPPKLAPSTWQLYFTDWIQRHQSMSGGDKKLNVAQAAKEAGQEYARLTPEQKEVR